MRCSAWPMRRTVFQFCVKRPSQEKSMEDFAKWIDQPIAHSGRLAAEPVNRMEATLDRNSDLADGDSLPPAWHWLYFNEGVPGSGLGIEGHPKVGGFMPPVPLPRRMWAGGTLHFHAPLIIGAEVVKRSTVRSVTPKTRPDRSPLLCQRLARDVAERRYCARRGANDRLSGATPAGRPPG